MKNLNVQILTNVLEMLATNWKKKPKYKGNIKLIQNNVKY